MRFDPAQVAAATGAGVVSSFGPQTGMVQGAGVTDLLGNGNSADSLPFAP